MEISKDFTFKEPLNSFNAMIKYSTNSIPSKTQVFGSIHI